MIYTSQGLATNELKELKKEPFEFVASFSNVKIPVINDIGSYKRNQAPYFISGLIKADENGNLKRNNDSLEYRDLIILDYDDLAAGSDLPKIVSTALEGISWIIYPTINHTAEKPRYRLIVKPSDVMNEQSYKLAVQEIADKIGLPFDMTSLTWSQLQGLPVKGGLIINRGADYPVSKSKEVLREPISRHFRRKTDRLSITMRIINTLLHGFGSEGGRNVALASFVGSLLTPIVNCDVPTAYELCQIANQVTDKPLEEKELDRTFKSIVKAEIKRR